MKAEVKTGLFLYLFKDVFKTSSREFSPLRIKKKEADLKPLLKIFCYIYSVGKLVY